MPVVQITAGSNNHYSRRFSYDSAYNASSITTGGYQSVSGNLLSEYRGFIEFNLSSLAGKKINRATLKLRPSSVSLDDRLELRLGWVTTDIEIAGINSSAGVTWSYYTAMLLQTADIGTYKECVITGLIRNFVNGTTPTKIIALYGSDNDQTYMARVDVGGFSSAYPPILEVDYDFIPPEKPTNLNVSHNGTTGTSEFIWQFNPSSTPGGDTQTGYDLQYSYDYLNWVTASRSTNESKHVFPAGTFTSGVVYWRVRTYNNLGGISEWSDIVQVNYNPEKPTELAAVYIPSTGETKFTWKFNPSAHNNDTVKGYDLQYGYDGVNWTTVSGGEWLEHIFPVGSFQAGTIFWRVRTKNSFGGISAWSDTAQFAFNGYTPGRPSVISPAGSVVMNTDVIFTWQHNARGSWDVQNRYELQYSIDGVNWKTISADNANTSVTVAKTEFETGTVWWKVRVRNTQGYFSEWAVTTTFTFAGKPKLPAIISGDFFSQANVTIEWVAAEQVAYELKILEGATEIVSTGIVVSATQKTYSRVMANNKTYTARVRIKNQFDIWSDWASKNFTVNFALPAKPRMYLLGNEKRGSIEIKIMNGTGGAAFLENEVYRKKLGATEWTKIAKSVSQNATFVDHTVISEEEYEYKVRTVGTTLGYNDSDSDIAKVRVRNTQLANTENYEEYVELAYNPKKTSSFKFDEHLMKFAGRKKPIVERGEFEETAISMSFTVLGYENLEKLIALIRKRETMLLRDSRKKKMYVTIDNLQVQEDWKPGEYEISFSVTEVDFSEVV